jgi:hypothetical protein
MKGGLKHHGINGIKEKLYLKISGNAAANFLCCALFEEL